MRLNQFLARATGLSRRAADEAIGAGRVEIAGQVAQLGSQVQDGDAVTLDGQQLQLASVATIIFHKPVGYVTSRRGQNSPTIYDLLPAKFQALKPVGRLDKDSSGLLILTNDGQLAQSLIHPSQAKTKHYRVKLDRALTDKDLAQLKRGIPLEEGLSRIKVVTSSGPNLTLELITGWNRQIRRTFAALGYEVVELERTAIGQIELGDLKLGQWRVLEAIK